MKKRVFCLLLSFILCFSLFSFPALANNTNSTSCYIASEDCPPNYLKYAEENISKFILSINTNLDASKVLIGIPFSFANSDPDVYYFPVIYDGTIKYLFRVYPDGDSFSGVISSFLSKEIESLAHLTTENSPMYLTSYENKIIATIGENTYELFQYPEYLSDNSETLTSRLETSCTIKNVKNSSNISVNLQQTRDTYEYINLNISETQGQNSWCTAYCLAAIVRKQTNFYVTARGLMINVLGANPDTSTAFPWESDNGVTMRSVMGSYNLYPQVLTTTVSNSILCQEISAGRPCLVAMKTDTVKHSVVLRGWSSIGTWSIWNPWYSTYENYPMTGAYVPAGKTADEWSFEPYMHAYNFG